MSTLLLMEQVTWGGVCGIKPMICIIANYNAACIRVKAFINLNFFLSWSVSWLSCSLAVQESVKIPSRLKNQAIYMHSLKFASWWCHLKRCLSYCYLKGLVLPSRLLHISQGLTMSLIERGQHFQRGLATTPCPLQVFGFAPRNTGLSARGAVSGQDWNG